MKKYLTKTMTAILFAALLFAVGCKKPKEVVAPKVVMDEQSAAVSYNKAWLFAEVVDDGGSTVTERGFCYGKAGEMLDGVVLVEGGQRFSGELPGLEPMTSYTCKAFAGNEAGRGYSVEFTFTTLVDTIPTVVTYEVRDITYHSAVISGQVLSGGGQAVLERGICYGTEPLPTVGSTCVSAGADVGPFECVLTDLQPDTRYYFRAYAVCTKGVYYGHPFAFGTKLLPMAVSTLGVSEVSGTRAKAAGKVIRDGGLEVTECGFCWGTGHHPTIEGLHIKAGVGTDEFSSYFSGLEKGQTHYLRAYAINEDGVAYGDEIAFFPDDAFTPWPEGVLPGLFSVGHDSLVRFSQGNLQFYPDENMWRFAERQWDFVGGRITDMQYGDMEVGTVYANGAKCDNTKTTRYYEGWIDLFGWGTSGWNNGNEYYRPYDIASVAYHCASYGPPGNFDLTGDYAEADWGIHNTISNGGSRSWRTPSVYEVLYLMNERETPSGMRFAKAIVAGICGMILLPDNWDAAIYPLQTVNEHCVYSVNRISGHEWVEVLEPAGAVFLPAAGERYQLTGYDGIWYDNSVSSMFMMGGTYWTTTQTGVNIAHALKVLPYPTSYHECLNSEASRCNGCSVRLISDE